MNRKPVTTGRDPVACVTVSPPRTAQPFQANSSTNQRAAASRPKRSKRPVSDKPMPPRSGVSRRKLELGKLRKAVSMRQERGIPINAKKWAQAVAMILASKKGKPTGADLACGADGQASNRRAMSAS